MSRLTANFYFLGVIFSLIRAGLDRAADSRVRVSHKQKRLEEDHSVLLQTQSILSSDTGTEDAELCLLSTELGRTSAESRTNPEGKT